MKNTKYVKILIIILFLFSGIFAQNSSLFSNTHKGLGLSNHFLSAAAMCMGNAGLANSDSTNLNLYNYSQWSKTKYTYFSFNIKGENNSFETNSLKESKSSGGIGAFILSIPLMAGKLSSFITFYPAYSMDHKNYQKNDIGTEFENDMYLSHKGHLIQYNGGFAYNVNSFIQVAGNFIYFSGSYKDENVIIFSNSNFNDLNFIDNYTVKGYGFGFSTTINLPQNISLATYAEKVNSCKFKVLPSEEGIGNFPSETKNTSLPYNVGVGLTWRPNTKMNIAFDYIYKNWEAGVPTFNKDENFFEDIQQFYAGVEYRPTSKWNSSMFKKITSRFGIFKGNEGYKFNNNSVNFIGISGGFGIPMNNLGARMDIALSGGIRGDLSDNGAKEQFVKFGVSFKVGEKWFVRRKN